MKRLLTLYLVLLVAAVAMAQRFPPGPLVSSKKAAAAGGGSPSSSFSDDFNRANNASLGANWTEHAGNIDISSNTALGQTASFQKMLAIYSGTAAATVEQYVKGTISGAMYPELNFRFTDASSAYYGVQFQVSENNALFLSYASVAAGATTEETIALTVDSGDSFGITCSGTGTSTVIRVWRNPTGNQPDSMTSWGGDNTPDCTFTANPTAAADSGTYIGIGGYEDVAGDFSWENFYGGSF